MRQINHGASKIVHPSHGDYSRERAAVEDAQIFYFMNTAYSVS
jgi:hypothetical protein